MRRTVKEAVEHLKESKELLEENMRGELFVLRAVEYTIDKLTISKELIMKKQSIVNDHLANDSTSNSNNDEIEVALEEAEATMDSIESVLFSTTQAIKRKEERENKLFEHNCRMEILDKEMRERIEIEKIHAEKDTRTNTLGLHAVSTKLPKLQIAPFTGNIMHWQSFWDAFKSAIHDNVGLTSIDKFNYLRSLLEGKARRVIEGLDLTSLNYENAVGLLKRRFGKNRSFCQPIIQN